MSWQGCADITAKQVTFLPLKDASDGEKAVHQITEIMANVVKSENNMSVKMLIKENRALRKRYH